MPIGSTTAAAMAAKHAAIYCMFCYAVSAEMVAALALTQTNPETVVWSTTELKLYCFMGSLGGAILKLALLSINDLDHSTNKMVVSRMAWEFLAAGICGLVFSPVALRAVNHSIGWPLDVDLVLAASGLVSFGGLWLAVPALNKFIDWVEKKKAGPP